MRLNELLHKGHLQAQSRVPDVQGFRMSSPETIVRAAYSRDQPVWASLAVKAAITKDELSDIMPFVENPHYMRFERGEEQLTLSKFGPFILADYNSRELAHLFGVRYRMARGIDTAAILASFEPDSQLVIRDQRKQIIHRRGYISVEDKALDNRSASRMCRLSAVARRASGECLDGDFHLTRIWYNDHVIGKAGQDCYIRV
jgi:hypothetical protein